MNSTLKSWLYIFISVVIFGAVAMFFITILPYLIIGGLIIYIISKFRSKKTKNEESSSSYTNVYESETVYKNSNKSTYNESEEKVIDVEFKDVE